MSSVLFMQIWAHIEKLDAEVLTEDAPPLFRSAVCFGLRRPINEAWSICYLSSVLFSKLV